MKNMIASTAPTGKVITHEITMFLTIVKLMAAIPLAKPTPMIAPTNV